WVEEQQFHVEDQEQNGDEIELHVKLVMRGADRVHARFVWHQLDGCLLLGVENVRTNDGTNRNEDAENQVQEDGIICGQIESRLRAGRRLHGDISQEKHYRPLPERSHSHSPLSLPGRGDGGFWKSNPPHPSPLPSGGEGECYDDFVKKITK